MKKCFDISKIIFVLFFILFDLFLVLSTLHNFSPPSQLQATSLDHELYFSNNLLLSFLNISRPHPFIFSSGVLVVSYPLVSMTELSLLFHRHFHV